MTYSRISSGSMILVSLLFAATSSVQADNGPRPEPVETKTVQISNFQFQPQEPVSYTHLTLPTILLV